MNFLKTKQEFRTISSHKYLSQKSIDPNFKISKIIREKYR